MEKTFLASRRRRPAESGAYTRRHGCNPFLFLFGSSQNMSPNSSIYATYI